MKKKTCGERRRTIIALLLFACMLYNCSPTLRLPVSTDAKIQQHLLAGRQLYVNHCSSCHNLHFPKEYDATGWQKHLNRMQVRAKITEEEKQNIYEYLISLP